MDGDQEFTDNDAEALFNESVDADQSASGATLAERLKAPKARIEQEGPDTDPAEQSFDDADAAPAKNEQPEPPAEQSEVDVRQLANQMTTMAAQMQAMQRSLDGKYGGLSQQVKQFQTELAAAKQMSAATAKAGGDAPSDARITQALADKAAGDPEGWKEIEEEFPALANGVKALIRNAQEQILSSIPKPEQKSAEPAHDPRVDQILEEREIDRQSRMVAERYPNYREIGRSEAWQKFVGNLHPSMQKMANSNDATEVLSILDLFTAQPGQGQRLAEDAPNRNRLVAAAALPRGHGQTTRKVVNENEMTPEQLFDLAVRRDEESARRR